MYDADLPTTQCKQHGFDLRSDGGIIYAPPSYYTFKGITFTYEFIKQPTNHALSVVPSELKALLLSVLTAKTKVKRIGKVIPIAKNFPPLDYPEFKTPYVLELIGNDISYCELLKESLSDIIDKLNPLRNNTYELWVNLGMSLVKFGKYGIDLWKKFSKKCSIYNENEINYKINTFSVKQGYKYKSLLKYLLEDNPIYFNSEFSIKYGQLLDHVNFNPRITKLKMLYNSGDVGLVNYFCDKHKKDIVFSGEYFYVYSEKSCLWEKYFPEEVKIDVFMIDMQGVFAPLVNYYYTKIETYTDYLELDESEKDLYGGCEITQQDIANLKKKAESIRTLKEIFKIASASHLMNSIKAKLHDDKFVESLNNVKLCHIPVKNGVVDLTTGIVRKREYDDYFSFELNVEWKGLEYPTPDFDNFFNDIMLGDIPKIDYLQKSLGYSITGLINECLFLIFNGVGSNGKTILLNLLQNLLGPYYAQITTDVITGNKLSGGASAAPHIIQLVGSRVACLDETSSDVNLNEEVIKLLTGGSSITSRPLYGNLTTFKHYNQVILSTNYLPVIKNNDSEALVRRIRLIKFLARFLPEDQLDKSNPCHKLRINDKEAELLGKLDQFLVWIVKGSVKYFKTGLNQTPPEILSATKEYFIDNDNIESFLNEFYDRDPNSGVPLKDLYAAYKVHSGDSISCSNFSKILINKKFVKKRMSYGNEIIGLKEKPDIYADNRPTIDDIKRSNVTNIEVNDPTHVDGNTNEKAIVPITINTQPKKIIKIVPKNPVAKKGECLL